MPGRAVALALIILVIVGGVPALGGAVAPPQATDSGPTIYRSTTLSLTPEQPGEVDVVVQFTVPDTVSQITTRLPRASRDVQSDGFENVGNTTWRWERGDGRPTLRYSLGVNKTGSAPTLHESHGTQEEYQFVDTGPWAVVDVPRMPLTWIRSGPPVSFEGQVNIDGVGATGGEMAFLGPFEAHSRTIHDQTFRLVVPTAAELGPSPGAILDSLAHASDKLRVGERDESVFFIAAPETVSWGARGLSGGSDAWVVADEPLNQAFNPWIHEYVHTRQAFSPAAETRWTVEATATYYAALYTLQQDRIDFQAFQSLLERGTEDPVDDGVLAAPGSWEGAVPYLKGALVWGGLDYRLRAQSDGEMAALELFARMNADSDELTQLELRELTDAVGTSATVEYLTRYTETSASPEMWTLETHADTFGTEPPRFAYNWTEDAFAVTSLYRNVSRLPSTLVVGETLRVRATVTNVGEIRGSYATALRVAGAPVASLSGSLAPGASERLEASHTFDEPGIVTVALGSERVQVRVAEPATPTVSNLSVDRQTRSSPGPVTVSVTVENGNDWPAEGDLPVTVDGETVATLSPHLLAGAETTRTVTVNLVSPGEHVIAVGGEEVRVTIEGSTAAGPGFGLTAAVAALVIVVLLLARRGSRP